MRAAAQRQLDGDDGDAGRGELTTPTAYPATQGAWTITLPHNIIGISVVPGTLTVTVDWGADGTPDRTWTFTNAQVGSEAG